MFFAVTLTVRFYVDLKIFFATGKISGFLLDFRTFCHYEWGYGARVPLKLFVYISN